ncbi:MAG: hypothetical protein ABMB14_28210 [Myxococcota bacterium]
MYSSLDRLDFTVTEGGRTVGVQTDHRYAREVEDEGDVSVLFLAARVVNPLRSAACDVVRIRAVYEPPAAYRTLCALAGAELELDPTGEIRPPARDDAQFDAAVAASADALGIRVVKAGVKDADLDALASSSAAWRDAAAEARREDLEFAWWTRVVELGAALGAVARRSGGAWVRELGGSGAVPYVIHDGVDRSVDVFGAVEAYFAGGPSPVEALKAFVGRGRVMFALRPPDWPGRPHALIGARSLDGGPVVAVVRDLGRSIAALAPATAPDVARRAEAEAERNLAEVDVTVEDADELGVLLVTGEYAAEKMLDRAFVRALQARLGAPALHVGVPRTGWALVYGAGPDVWRFTGLVARAYEAAPPGARLSPEVWLAVDGELHGTVRVTVTPPTLRSRAIAWFRGRIGRG